ncbi:hypothetical protein GCM10022222_43970 [Amycolatopsis ultiminotia]|uniref:Uncharacterized protein n=1 Tax=Amycolatopsis ultiminotia TaxID=543629 RepID=A0ABP6WSJ7_9PSEU
MHIQVRQQPSFAIASLGSGPGQAAQTEPATSRVRTPSSPLSRAAAALLAR